MPPSPIKVLVVEDSPVAQLLLVHIINSDPRLTVLGAANSGEEALEFLKRNKPDVIVMDIHMPGMDGYETTRRIMETEPVPIVVCSASFNPSEVANTFRAMEVGALALVAKPVGLGHDEYENMARELTETVRLMSEVKVVKRWPRTPRMGAPVGVPSVHDLPASSASVKVVAIGASTGGPIALQAILAGLPGDFPAPVLIVQHMTPGFLDGLAEWLQQSTGFPVHIATPNEVPRPGHAYLAPDGAHLGVDAAGHVVLSRSDPENGLRPSVAHLFRTVAENQGKNAIGVLLTGMGKDGAAELKLMKEKGAVTVAQDKATSVVHGMPGEAIRLEAVVHVLPPERIAEALIRFMKPQLKRRTYP